MTEAEICGSEARERARPYGPFLASGDEVGQLFPDLSSLLLSSDTDAKGQRVCRLDNLVSALAQLGHKDETIQAVLDMICAIGLTARTTINAPEDANVPLIEVPALAAAERSLSEWKSLTLALSGGGLRAALFQVGILSYLALSNELQHVRVIVSVSGGSITAAHFATRWARAIQGRQGFVDVAAELVKFTQTNIRDSAIIPWLRSLLLLLPMFRRRFRRTWLLEKVYKRHFSDATLGELPAGEGFPRLAFVATDATRNQRVVLMSEGIFRFTFGGKPVADRIVATGVHLSLAVAASSCFPPVFPRLKLRHRELGLRYDEFDGELRLNDGGVSGNLGVEALSALRDQQRVPGGTVLLCDAENGLAEEPGDTPITDIFSQGDALSASARKFIEKDVNAKMLRFADRAPEGRGLPFRVQTALSSYRTDLDCPTWQECEALMIHGAAICENALTNRPVQVRPGLDTLRSALRDILVSAGAPPDLAPPNEASLQKCGRRPKRRILSCMLLVTIMLLTEFSLICEGVAAICPTMPVRPLPALWRLLWPEPVHEREINNLATQLATSMCDNTLADLETALKKGRTRVTVIVGANPSSSLIYFNKTVLAPKCDHEVSCQFVFRGSFGDPHPRSGDSVIITGKAGAVRGTTEQLNAYIDFDQCSAFSVSK